MYIYSFSVVGDTPRTTVRQSVFLAGVLQFTYASLLNFKRVAK
uniref:Uncharacterized protein n=1 Tax=Anguilla anguilla TaxID=7936 RepID=A0A0E9RBQ9_ANGAN